MLIKCPECELQVSDKAYACPHCGYPLKGPIREEPKPKISIEEPEKKPQTRTAKHRRLPNGFGQISEIKDKNLRNRFRVMITVSKTPEGKPICKLLKPKAYFATYNEAYTALVNYNKNPYDLDSIIILKDLYDNWSKEYFKKMSVKTARAYRSTWRYCSPLYSMRVMEIRARHIKQCIEEASYLNKDGETVKASARTKSVMKILFNALFDYAVEYDIADKNYARAFKLPDEIGKEIEANRVEHIAFEEEEINALWENRDKSPYIDYLLYQIYSGWRPTEFCQLLINDVDLKDKAIRGGIKTDAGKNRLVPIHPKVYDIVEREYHRAKELNSYYLFNYTNKNKFGNIKLSYEGYRQIFHGVVELLNLNPEHKPHDTRKTFVTLAKKYKMDEYALKRIVGHDIDDITEAIYTERSLDWYHEEMQKIK